MDYNILIADFAGKNRICMTDTLYQYDYGQKLQIVNIAALPQTFEAHFSNVQHGGVSITVTGMDGIVDIPNSLLMTGKRIYCWIYVTEPGSGETEYQVLIPVQARPMPEYYDVTDVGVFDSVVQQVGDYAATATAGATSATASATAAATSASEAAASASAAETAKNAAETAQGKAEDAQTAAETAAQTATEKAQQTAQDAAQTAQSKADAESAAGRAEAAQTGAESAKTGAETAAQDAADSASAASASATSAGQAATSAGQSATAAAGSATTAENAAQTATTKAGEASASATAANTAKTVAQTAQTGAETAATNAGQSASTATTKAAEAATSASNAAQSKTDAEAAAARAEQAAASLTIDSALSDTSVNPVQNKVITESVTQLKSHFDVLGIGAKIILYDGDWHSANNDKITVSIQQGEVIYVWIKQNVNPTTMYIYAFNGSTSTRIEDNAKYINGFYRIISPGNYDALSLYINGGTSGTVEFAVIKDQDVLLAKPNANAVRIDNMGKYGITTFNVADFVIGSLTNGVFQSHIRRVCTYPNILTYPYKLQLSANDGYRFGIHEFDENGQYISDSGWKTSYTVDAGKRFRIVIASANDSSYANLIDYVNNVLFYTNGMQTCLELAKKINEESAVAYYYDGSDINVKRKGYNIYQMYGMPSLPEGTGSNQGFAIYGGVLFQFYSNNKVTLIDFSTGTSITTLDVISDHGDTVDFSNEFYATGDEFPLAYITADTTPAKIYVVRITRTETSLIRTYYFGDITKTGYFAGHCLDPVNHIIYTVGYTENSYYLNTNGTNKMVISAWDITNCSENQDGTLTPTLKKTFTVPFMITLQGQRYFDNKLFLLSSHNGAGDIAIDTKIYVLDPFREIITNVIDDFPTAIKTHEAEAIDFVLDDNQYDMILSTYTYYRVKFN